MKNIHFILLLIVAIGCQKASTPEQQAIDTANVTYQEDQTKENAQVLLEAMATYVSMNGYKDTIAGRYALDAARLSNKVNDLQQARGWYRDYLVAYPDRTGQADLLAEYISVSEKLNRKSGVSV